MEGMMDLIIYSRDDGENIDKFSAEYITKFALKDGRLLVESTQRSGTAEYMAEGAGFFFQAR